MKTSSAQLCNRDTDGDGNCHLCDKKGCPLSVFALCTIDPATMTDEQVSEFRSNAERFVYSEWPGTIRGYRDSLGRVLIEEVLTD